jgi:hypothetical protein
MAALVNEEGRSTKKMTVFITVPRPLPLRQYHHVDLKDVSLEVSSDDTVASVKATLHNMVGIPPCRQRLVFARSALPDDDDTTLAAHGIVGSPTIQLVETEMEVFMRNLAGKTITFSGVESSDTVESFRIRVQEREGILLRPTKQRLIWGANQIEDGHTLADYGVGHFATMHLMCRPSGLRMREIELDIKVTDTVGRIKERVEEAEGIPAACQSVSYHGKQLDDRRALADYEPLQWIDITCRRHETQGGTNSTIQMETVKKHANVEVTGPGKKIKKRKKIPAMQRKRVHVYLFGPEQPQICPSSCDADPVM